MDKDLIAKFIFALLPNKSPYTIAIDRTNWKLGKINITILVLAIVYERVVFPILLKLIPKQVNSNANERIQIMSNFIRLFGEDSINYLVANLEFVCEHWVNYLNLDRIEYHIRIRENFRVLNPKRVKN